MHILFESKKNKSEKNLIITIQTQTVPYAISKLQKDLPMKIDEGMTLTRVYESGKTIYYVVVIDTEVSKEDLQISQNNIEKDKQNVIAAFRREMGRDMNQVKSLINGIVYLYKNKNGEELFRIAISVSEL